MWRKGVKILNCFKSDVPSRFIRDESLGYKNTKFGALLVLTTNQKSRDLYNGQRLHALK